MSDLPRDLDERRGRLLEQAIANSENLVTEAHRLRGEISAVDTARSRDRQVYLTLIVVVLALMGGLGWQQQQLRAAADVQLDTQRTLLDCVTPEGRCFAGNQARTAAAVATLDEATRQATERAAIAAAACIIRAEPADTIREIKTCVTSRIDALEQRGGGGQ